MKEEELEIVIAPSRRKANYERCQKICETYLEIARFPQFMYDKETRKQIACSIKQVRRNLLFNV